MTSGVHIQDVITLSIAQYTVNIMQMRPNISNDDKHNDSE